MSLAGTVLVTAGLITMISCASSGLHSGRQVRGKVVDAKDQPVQGAVVEMTVDGSLIGRAVVDQAGSFEIVRVFSVSGSERPSVIVCAMHDGYEQSCLPTTDSDTTLVLRLRAK